MTIMEAVVITEWKRPLDDPDAKNGFISRLGEDYPHHVQETLLSQGKHNTYGEAQAAAEAAGPSFRTVDYLGMTTTVVSYGIRVTQLTLDQLVADAAAKHISVASLYPYLLGVHKNDLETQEEVWQITSTIATDGARTIEDVTGQPIEAIIPDPNQFSVLVVCSEAVLAAIEADANYFYMAGNVRESAPVRESEPPQSAPPQARTSPLAKPFDEPASQAHKDAYQAWQNSRGVPIGLLDDLDRESRLIRRDGQTTYGSMTVETATFQQQLDKTPGQMRLPLRSQVARQAFRALPHALREDQMSRILRGSYAAERMAERKRQREEKERRQRPPRPPRPVDVDQENIRPAPEPKPGPVR